MHINCIVTCEHDMTQVFIFLLLLHWQCPCSSVSHHVNEPEHFPHMLFTLLMHVC